MPPRIFVLQILEDFAGDFLGGFFSGHFFLQKSGEKIRRLKNSQSPDLPLPHGLVPSETVVRDHGLNPSLSSETPRIKGSSGSGVPIFAFGLADPAPKV